MATNRRATNYNRSQYNRPMQGTNQSYVYGSAAPQPVAPTRHQRPEPTPTIQKPPSHQVYKNRRRALQMNGRYAFFLATVAVLAVVLCSMYLHLQSSVSQNAVRVTQLQRELAVMHEANHAALGALADAVNLTEVRSYAVAELGLITLASANTIEYQRPEESHVTIHHNIPENGVLPNSLSSR